MDTASQHRPDKVSPMRHDPPGAVRAMPSPAKIHHVHIFSDVNYDAMVAFYKTLFNADVVTVAKFGDGQLTFLTYDDHDHRVIIIKRAGWGTKPERPVGVSHCAFGYASLGEVMYVHKRMKELGYPKPGYCVNHGNSTSLYFTDPDGNQVEIMVDNFTPLECQDYKRHYQFSEAFGDMDEAKFDPDKMLALYEEGVPDSVLMDREKVRELVREGRL